MGVLILAEDTGHAPRADAPLSPARSHVPSYSGHPWRMTVIRFKIGDAFPADDPVARFITGLGMISNDWLRLITDMVSDEDDSREGIGRRISLFRRQAALVHEAATFITDARRMFPAVASFVDGLDATHVLAVSG